MIKLHSLGFPKIGKNREWKKAIESYWSGNISLEKLEKLGKELRLNNWQLQNNSGLDYVPVGDFNYYDHILNASLTLGVIPSRFSSIDRKNITLDDMFLMARGRSARGIEESASEMTKWFDTNYHYIVPEFTKNQKFELSFSSLFDEVAEAHKAGFKAKPVFIGPVSYLWLGKVKGDDFDKLSLLKPLLNVYQEILSKLLAQGVEWIELDEPILSMELDENWQEAIKDAYSAFNESGAGKNILLANYFDKLGENRDLAISLPVGGLHLDLIKGKSDFSYVEQKLAKDKILSAGIVDGGNIWINDIAASVEMLRGAYLRRGQNLWLAPSCSLLHVPVDATLEEKMDSDVKSWLAFSVQKLAELNQIRLGLIDGKGEEFINILKERQEILSVKQASMKVINQQVRGKVAGLDESDYKRKSSFAKRRIQQKDNLNLPLFPTTTIGSFPQTAQIRKYRRLYKSSQMSLVEYENKIKEEIDKVIQKQLKIGLDVLVHGEPERNDMVEYFGEQMAGFAFSTYGWVQSYGSRCVKPPIIYGDISRPNEITIKWSAYAKSKLDANKIVKGMLTGPITMLRWSFVRDDLTQREVALQLALAIKEETLDLEKAGIQIIQIDEPAFREGMPLKNSEWKDYFDWAVGAFQVASSGVRDETQIHTHMCYSEFNDIMDAIAKMDADVISIEASRSGFELIGGLQNFKYPNDIGPGVYDIHSPNVPSTKEMVDLLKKASQLIDHEKLWVNPDCGLKTRNWPEVEKSLENMVQAAKTMRELC
ncbi:MAG: 5-methyltetrahydropteroyltriglutamate--homocysteine S-methyltransferase [SAR324 cluster bacterium]|nr:5-methyltetrahydropteroyltriglutamate--homocysteine S-methyltransferase [SAR324 cluster bacterium]